MTIPIDTTANLVSYNIQREIGDAMAHDHHCIMLGMHTPGELDKEISRIFKDQMQPLHAELRQYAKEGLPPKPTPVYRVLLMGLTLGAFLSLALRQKMFCTICMIMSLWATTLGSI